MVDAFELRPDGTVVGLYTDAIDLRALGRVCAERASAVEWDETAQAWHARIFATGQVLGLAVSVWQAGPGALSTVSATFPAASVVNTSLGMADQRSATTWIVPSDCRWTWTW